MTDARAAGSTRAAFFVAGFCMAAWAPLVPAAKARMNLSAPDLGLLLLCMGLGSVLTMPFAGSLAARFGCRKVILAAGLTACAALPFMAVISQVPQMAIALGLFGAGIGSIDVVMNLQAVLVQRAAGRPLMSGFHGLFSVGGTLGAGALTGMLALGWQPVLGAAAIGTLGAILLIGYSPTMLTHGGDASGPALALPRGRVLLIGALCFAMFLAEGSVLDWSGVLLNEHRGVSPALAGIGYAAFEVTMVVGRLSGDRLVHALGERKILVFGGLCAAFGFAVAALIPSWPAALVGFALVGAGASNVVPTLFSSAGRQPSMPAHLALAAVTTLGYAGILSGPAAIGFVAGATSLSVAMLFEGLMLLGVAAGARLVATP